MSRRRRTNARPSTRATGTSLVLALALGLTLLAACGQNMREQPRYEEYEPSEFFENGMSARPIDPDTVARGHLRADKHFFTGQVDGEPAVEFPFPVTQEVLERGRERYNIFCAPCHSQVGDGNGMIVQRGFTPPPSFHTQRLREAPVGYYYTVITNGQGAMYPYASRVPPADRWAIIAYIRALQLSQNASIEDLTPEERQKVEGAAR